MSDITDWEPLMKPDDPSQDKPLNTYDLNVIGAYVSTLKHDSPNKSTMSETPRELELIEGFYNFADQVATLINTEIVAALGDDANWEYWAGRDEIPEMFKENCSPEKFKRLSDLWTLRESASGYSCSLSEYDPAEWAKKQYEIAQQNDWKPLVETNKFIRAENEKLANASCELKKELSKLQRDYDSYKKSTERELQRLKNDVGISLRAIDLCILASITTEKQFLTHRQRNFRMQHIHQIICNEADRFGDRKLTSYEDDF